EQAGGTAFLAALASPFSGIKFCPTGGIEAANAPAYLALGNVACVGGSWVAPDALIAAGKWDEITSLAQQAALLRCNGSQAASVRLEFRHGEESDRLAAETIGIRGRHTAREALGVNGFRRAADNGRCLLRSAGIAGAGHRQIAG